jgi:hypothetical protein
VNNQLSSNLLILSPQVISRPRGRSHDWVSQKVPLCVNKLYLYLSLFNMVSQKVVSHFDVFGSPVENWVMG